MKIPLSTRIARWIRRALPAPRFAVAYEPELRTPMADGVALIADHYFPTPGLLQDFPTLLVRSPYGRGSPWAALYGLGFAEQGFHVLLQSTRGAASSGSVFPPWRDDGPDGHATVAWLRRQPWFDGRLGLVGPGATARAHWALAADPPPELKAMVMQVPLHDPRDFLQRSGYGRGTDLLPAADGLTVPTLVVSGWADAALDRALEHYRRLRAEHRSLLIGPWTHSSVLRQGIGTVFAESLAWLHGHLAGPAPPKGQVRVALGGTAEWRNLTAWPPAAVPMSWYPRHDGVLGREPPQGIVVGIVSSDSAGLAFTSPPLTEALDVIGTVAAEVTVELARPSATLLARLCDIDERGRSRNVCEGTGRLTGPSPSPVTVAMSSTAHRFQPGHQIRVHINGGAANQRYPRISRLWIHPGSVIVLPAA